MNELKQKWNFIGTDETLEAMYNRIAEPGDFVACLEDRTCYIFDGKQWNPIKTDGGLNMSLYDINKGAFGSMKPYDKDKLNELQKKIDNWELNSDFYMLLCNDIRYYTVLRNTQHKKSDFSSLGEAVVGLLLERNYTIHFDDIAPDYFEIWVKDSVGGEVYMFALFPYDWGVVNYG